MSKYSNILKVPSIADYSINIVKKIYNKLDLTNHQSQNLISSFSDYKKNANIIIETNSNKSLYQEKSLNEINKEDKYAILTLNVLLTFVLLS